MKATRPTSKPGRAATRRPTTPHAKPPDHALTQVATTDQDAEPQGLAVSVWFDPGTGDEPYTAIVRFSGRRVGGARGRPDTFVKDETVRGVIPDNGPVSVMARVSGIPAGEWAVTADVLRPARDRGGRPPQRMCRATPAAWSWRRWALSAGPATPVKTRLAALTTIARSPAVLPGSFASLVLLGVLVALTLQALLVARANIDAGTVLVISLLALLAGLAGAKLWYAAIHFQAWRKAPHVGWCIQGFLLGAAIAVTAGLAIADLPVGVVLDATAPGMFAGLAIGRIGCFFTGCCAGRPSASRWALWSSDRRVGARRIPTQLLESAAAGAIAATAWLLLTLVEPAVSGALVVASLAGYTLVRQWVLRLRVEPRQSTLGGPIVAGVAAAALVLAGALLFVALP
ncbi:MAG: prolipoprotein diacylglyceryl transferase family protein [Micromonosporaceae bacterium]